MKLAPQLKTEHRGYYDVVKAIVFLHLAFVLDALLRQHGPAFQTLRDVEGGTLLPWAALHLLSAALVLFGLYWPAHFAILRVGCAVSLLTFNVGAVTFGYTAVEHPSVSFYAAICSLGLSFMSLAAMREPMTNPANRVS